MLKIGTDLYRKLLIQAKRLPDEHAAAFFRSQVKETFRAHPEAEGSKDAVKRVQGANKLLRQLTAANDGYLHALTRALNTAYGRIGSGKHSRLKPFLPPTHLDQPTTFSPILSSLLQSSLTHNARPPTSAHLRNPPTLPPRAVPGSEAARLLGQLPLQRERAVRGRYWREQVGKLRAPVAVAVERARAGEEARGRIESAQAGEALRAVGIRMTVGEVEEGMRLLHRMEEQSRVPSVDRPLLPRRLRGLTRHEESLATSAPRSSPTKPQRKDPSIHPPQVYSSKWHNPKVVTPRLLRRRLAGILHDAPVVTVSVPEAEGEAAGQQGTPKVGVVRSSWARGGLERYSPLGEEGEWWHATFGEVGGKRGGKGTGQGPAGARAEPTANRPALTQRDTA